MMSNNLFSESQVKGLVDWIESSGYADALQSIARTDHPLVQDFSARLFTEAINSGHLRVVCALLRTGVPLGDSRPSKIKWALSESMSRGNWSVARLLLSSGPDLNDEDNTYGWIFSLLEKPLMIWMMGSACEKGVVFEDDINFMILIDLIEFLVKVGVRIKRSSYPSIRKAYNISRMIKHSRLLDLFHQAGVSYDSDEASSDEASSDEALESELDAQLHDAVRQGNINLLRSLIAQGASVESWLPSQCKPIALAVDKDNMEMVRELLDLGADPNGIAPCTDPARLGSHVSGPSSALHLASFQQQHALVEMLLERGASASAVDNRGRTPLHWAVRQSYNRLLAGIVTTLLHYGADVNASADGKTAIDVTLCEGREGFVEMAELLLAHGARISWLTHLETSSKIKDSIGRSPSQAVICFCRGYYHRYAQEHSDVPFSHLTTWLSEMYQKAADAIDLDTMRWLVREGADVSELRGLRCKTYAKIDSDGRAIWSDSRSWGFREVTIRQSVIWQHVVEHGGAVNAKSYERGMIPFLQVAIIDRDFAMMNFLLSQGAHVSHSPWPGMFSPIHLAISQWGDAFTFEATKALIAYGADTQAYKLIYDRGVAFWKDSVMVRSKPKKWEGDCSNFYMDIEPGEILVSYLQEVYYFEATPIQAACFHGKKALIQLLCNAGADLNAPAAREAGFTALQIAILKDQEEIVQLLLDAGVNINAPSATDAGMTAIQCAILRENIKLITKLIESGADVRAPAAAKVGIKALQAAIMTGNTDLANSLLDAGVDVNAPPGSDEGRTALQYAAERSDSDMAAKLLEHGADVNAPPCRFGGATALQYAARKGNIDLVIELLEWGADIDAPAAPKDGRTALEGAAENGRLDIVHLLLQEHTEPLSLKEKCQKAADLAEKQGHKVVVEVLRGWTDPSSIHSPFYASDEPEISSHLYVQRPLERSW